MRRATPIALGAGALAIGTCLVACFDLFHSTSDIVTACALDAQGPGCSDAVAPVADAGTDAANDFCAWQPVEARSHAEHACAWLGACESPLGRNAFGDCMIQALLAYDCTIAPAHPVAGKAHALWDCLWRVQSCGDVDACVFPGGPRGCASPEDYVSCANVDGVEPANGDVRMECVDGGGDGGSLPNGHGENCALWGQTCAGPTGSARCAGSTTGSFGCAPGSLLECKNGAVHGCAEAGASVTEDVGIDCTSYGDGRCNGYPTSSPQWVACEASGDGGACTPGLAVTCANGYATSCPAGVEERINCEALLSADGCNPSPLSPSFDWTSPCQVAGSTCTEECSDAGDVVGCARGATFTLHCAAEKLGACRMVTTDMGAAQHAACAPP
jgi:hypothetical protein